MAQDEKPKPFGMNPTLNSCTSHKIKNEMPPVDELQMELAAFLQKEFHVTKLTSILDPSTQDFWQPYRHKFPTALPTLRYDLNIAAEGYDAKTLTPNHVEFLTELGEKYGFDFDYVPTDEHSIFFMEHFLHEEFLGEQLVRLWQEPTPYKRFPKIYGTRAEFVEATKIFLRFVRSQNPDYEPTATKTAGRIISAMCRRIGGNILNKDRELAQLVT
jgi:hypothetical protein